MTPRSLAGGYGGCAPGSVAAGAPAPGHGKHQKGNSRTWATPDTASTGNSRTWATPDGASTGNSRTWATPDGATKKVRPCRNGWSGWPNDCAACASAVETGDGR